MFICIFTHKADIIVQPDTNVRVKGEIRRVKKMETMSVNTDRDEEYKSVITSFSRKSIYCEEQNIVIFKMSQIKIITIRCHQTFCFNQLSKSLKYPLSLKTWQQIHTKKGNNSSKLNV